MATDAHFEHATPLESPGFLLWRTTSAWQRTIRQALAPSSLTHVQFVLLAATAWILNQADVLPTQREIGQLAGSDANTVSETLRRMETSGLVRRREDNDDARARVVSITTRGSDLLAAAAPAVERADREFFANPDNRRILGQLAALAHQA